MSADDGVDLSFLHGGGEMGARMRAAGWALTPLGPARSWPQSLKTAVRIMLTSRQAMFVWWGDQLINLYNDAYKAIVGGKHPAVLGQPASVVWREIWDQVGPRVETVLTGDAGTYDEALLLIMERHGYPEETYYTFSYSPIPNDGGGTGGIICANTDDTQRIIGQRQLGLLKDLASEMSDARTVAEACRAAARALATAPRDLPFAALYLLDDKARTVTLAGTAGIASGHVAAPEAASLDDEAFWPFRSAIGQGDASIVDGLSGRGADLPRGDWDRPPVKAAMLPILPRGAQGQAGILVAGLNPYRPYDAAYGDFLALVGGQIAAGIANAEAHQEERRRVEALAELDRAKTNFLSNASHELRTPLTLMLAPLEGLLEGTPTAEMVLANRQELALMHRNGLRLLKLVNTLLDFSRIEAGRVQASYEPVDLALLTGELSSVFRSAMERAGLRFVVDCPPLPMPVHVDREMWEKIVLNLLSNAFKYTFQGEVVVALRAAPGGDSVTVTVRLGSDHLPPDRIGAARSSSSIDQADAFLEEMRHWGGVADAAPGSGGLGEDLPAPTGDGRPFVLLADDNADMRHYVGRLLGARFDVQSVEDGEAAFEAALRRRPDLVLSDVMMPRLDGFGLLR
jgi:signal transduction histidine kinase